MKIQQFESNPVRYRPQGIFERDRAGILTLRGPRQVGKSTLIKLAIRDLLKTVEPLRIFFYSMEDIEEQSKLVDLIKTYHSLCLKNKVAGKFRYMFLDEISFVDRWELGIKQLYEQGLLENTLVLITGSNARDLHHQAERLPGRRGTYDLPDRVLLPLSFRQYLEAKKFEYLEKLPDLALASVIENEGVCEKLLSLDGILPALSRELDMYLLNGGMLTAINDMARDNQVLTSTYITYLQWIRGDIVKMGRSEHVAREALIGIREKIATALGWNALKERVSDIYGGNISEYAWTFAEMFLTKQISQLDPERNKNHPKKQKKIYFIDPLFFWTAFYWERKWSDPHAMCLEYMHEFKPRLIEQLVASHLFRLDERDWFSSMTSFWMGFKEIDFLTQDGKGAIIPIEVKYQTAVGDGDFLAMKKAGFKKGIVISKDVLAKNGDCFYTIPASLFLSLT